MCVIASNISEPMVFASAYAYATAKYHREIKKMWAKKEDGSADDQCL